MASSTSAASERSSIPNRGDQRARLFAFKADGVNSRIELNKLERILDRSNIDHFGTPGYSTIDVTNSGVINASALTNLSAVKVNLTSGSNLPISQIQTLIDGGLNINGGTHVWSSLTSTKGSVITVAGGSLQVPQLSDINGGSVLVSQGSTLSLPLVLSYEHTGTGRTVLQAKIKAAY